jgi:hypothetical protein
MPSMELTQKYYTALERVCRYYKELMALPSSSVDEDLRKKAEESQMQALDFSQSLRDAIEAMEEDAKRARDAQEEKDARRAELLRLGQGLEEATEKFRDPVQKQFLFYEGVTENSMPETLPQVVFLGGEARPSAASSNDEVLRELFQSTIVEENPSHVLPEPQKIEGVLDLNQAFWKVSPKQLTQE